MKYKISFLLIALSASTFAQPSLDEQLSAIGAAESRFKGEEQQKLHAQQMAEKERQLVEQKRREHAEAAEREKQKRAHEIAKKKLEHNIALDKQRAAQEAKERQRNQAYEDEMRRMDLQERKAELAARRAKADRSNDYIDRELKREDAHTDVVHSRADANRNTSEGMRDMMKGIGKGAEKHGLGK